MQTNVLILIIILESLALLFVVLKHFFKRFDGRLMIDEARDSWTVAITTDPAKVNKKKALELKIEKTVYNQQQH